MGMNSPREVYHYTCSWHENIEDENIEVVSGYNLCQRSFLSTLEYKFLKKQTKKKKPKKKKTKKKKKKKKKKKTTPPKKTKNSK
jgi:hypothetical protein